MTKIISNSYHRRWIKFITFTIIAAFIAQDCALAAKPNMLMPDSKKDIEALAVLLHSLSGQNPEEAWAQYKSGDYKGREDRIREQLTLPQLELLKKWLAERERNTNLPPIPAGARILFNRLLGVYAKEGLNELVKKHLSHLGEFLAKGEGFSAEDLMRIIGIVKEMRGTNGVELTEPPDSRFEYISAGNVRVVKIEKDIEGIPIGVKVYDNEGDILAGFDRFGNKHEEYTYENWQGNKSLKKVVISHLMDDSKIILINEKASLSEENFRIYSGTASSIGRLKLEHARNDGLAYLNIWDVFIISRLFNQKTGMSVLNWAVSYAREIRDTGAVNCYVSLISNPKVVQIGRLLLKGMEVRYVNKWGAYDASRVLDFFGPITITYAGVSAGHINRSGSFRSAADISSDWNVSYKDGVVTIKDEDSVPIEDFTLRFTGYAGLRGIANPITLVRDDKKGVFYQYQDGEVIGSGVSRQAMPLTAASAGKPFIPTGRALPGYNELEFAEDFEGKIGIKKGGENVEIGYNYIEPASGEDLLALTREAAAYFEKLTEGADFQGYLKRLLRDRPPNRDTKGILLKIAKSNPPEGKKPLGRNSARYYLKDSESAAVVFDEGFINILLKYKNRFPEAVKWLFAERLLHELYHDNETGDAEKEIFEETDIILSNDKRLYENFVYETGLGGKIKNLWGEMTAAEKAVMQSGVFFKMIESLIRKERGKLQAGGSHLEIDTFIRSIATRYVGKLYQTAPAKGFPTGENPAGRAEIAPAKSGFTVVDKEFKVGGRTLKLSEIRQGRHNQYLADCLASADIKVVRDAVKSISYGMDSRALDEPARRRNMEILELIQAIAVYNEIVINNVVGLFVTYGDPAVQKLAAGIYAEYIKRKEAAAHARTGKGLDPKKEISPLEEEVLSLEEEVTRLSDKEFTEIFMAGAAEVRNGTLTLRELRQRIIEKQGEVVYHNLAELFKERKNMRAALAELLIKLPWAVSRREMVEAQYAKVRIELGKGMEHIETAGGRVCVNEMITLEGYESYGEGVVLGIWEQGGETWIEISFKKKGILRFNLDGVKDKIEKIRVAAADVSSDREILKEKMEVQGGRQGSLNPALATPGMYTKEQHAKTNKKLWKDLIGFKKYIKVHFSSNEFDIEFGRKDEEIIFSEAAEKENLIRNKIARVMELLRQNGGDLNGLGLYLVPPEDETHPYFLRAEVIDGRSEYQVAHAGNYYGAAKNMFMTLPAFVELPDEFIARVLQREARLSRQRYLEGNDGEDIEASCGRIINRLKSGGNLASLIGENHPLMRFLRRNEDKFAEYIRAKREIMSVPSWSPDQFIKLQQDFFADLIKDLDASGEFSFSITEIAGLWSFVEGMLSLKEKEYDYCAIDRYSMAKLFIIAYIIKKYSTRQKNLREVLGALSGISCEDVDNSFDAAYEKVSGVFSREEFIDFIRKLRQTQNRILYSLEIINKSDASNDSTREIDENFRGAFSHLVYLADSAMDEEICLDYNPAGEDVEASREKIIEHLKTGWDQSGMLPLNHPLRKFLEQNSGNFKGYAEFVKAHELDSAEHKERRKIFFDDLIRQLNALGDFSLALPELVGFWDILRKQLTLLNLSGQAEEQKIYAESEKNLPFDHCRKDRYQAAKIVFIAYAIRKIGYAGKIEDVLRLLETKGRKEAQEIFSDEQFLLFSKIFTAEMNRININGGERLLAEHKIPLTREFSENFNGAFGQIKGQIKMLLMRKIYSDTAEPSGGGHAEEAGKILDEVEACDGVRKMYPALVEGIKAKYPQVEPVQLNTLLDIIVTGELPNSWTDLKDLISDENDFEFITRIGIDVEKASGGIALSDDRKALIIEAIAVRVLSSRHGKTENSRWIDAKIQADLEKMGYGAKAKGIIAALRNIEKRREAGKMDGADYNFTTALEKLLGYARGTISSRINRAELQKAGNPVEEKLLEMFKSNLEQWGILAVVKDKGPAKGIIAQNISGIGPGFINWLEGLKRRGVNINNLRFAFIADGENADRAEEIQANLSTRFSGIKIIVRDGLETIINEFPDNIVYLAGEEDARDCKNKYSNVKIVEKRHAGPVIELNLCLTILPAGNRDEVKIIYRDFLNRLAEKGFITKEQIGTLVNDIERQGFIKLPDVKREVLDMWEELERGSSYKDYISKSA